MENIFYLVALWVIAFFWGTLGATYAFGFSVITQIALGNKIQKFSKLKEIMSQKKNTASMLFYGGLEYLENTELRVIYCLLSFASLIISLIMDHINNTQYDTSIFVILSVLILFFNFFSYYVAKKDKMKFEDIKEEIMKKGEK